MSAPDKPVRVFKNHTLGCYTILRGAKVVACARQLRLADVNFLVRESGRKRMLANGRRTIHAYAVGRLIEYVGLDESADLAPMTGRRASYDAERFAHFYDGETEALLLGARYVQLDDEGMVYSGGRFTVTAQAA